MIPKTIESLTSLPLLGAFKWRHSMRSCAGGVFAEGWRDVVNAAIEKADLAPTPFSTAARRRPATPGTISYGAVKGEPGGSSRRSVAALQRGSSSPRKSMPQFAAKSQ
jgi:hypothetical protein